MTKEILEEEYQEFIWLFLEKVTYFLIVALKELNRNSEVSESNLQIEVINSSTRIHCSNENVIEVKKNKAIAKICKLLASYQKLAVCEIPIGNAFISHSKLGKENIESFKLNLSPLEIRMGTKIRQEWGSSIWKIEVYIDSNSKTYIYCKEIGKYKMSFFFN